MRRVYLCRVGWFRAEVTASKKTLGAGKNSKMKTPWVRGEWLEITMLREEGAGTQEPQ